ncbi:MAG TPA: CDP-alcohol phosphatidyltransferase family protein, partial [Pyrinomonadaceae bacterium]|nr:CDP-alcohol phosphatidyltransferase family protein [Pyrinomonadaceae bacterium]
MWKVMASEQLAYASKASTSFFSPMERRMARRVLPLIPRWLETYHLTWLTLVWSVLIAFFSYLAGGEVRWLWGVSLAVALHYVTDFFDGKLGKFRATGLVKWGFFMDHFLDYFFLCALLIGYSFILPPASTFHLFLVFAVFAGFMLHSFLAFAATGELRISV